jgi:dienelactone hydrolase
MGKLSACLVLLTSVSAAAVGGQDLKVQADTIDGVRAPDMMSRYLLGQIDQAWQRWQADYENRKTPEQIAAYQKLLREKFLEAIGPFPERTPLNAKVTGTLSRNGCRVEKVIFESMPGFHVTGAIFLPDPERHKPPYPGVLVPCGHSHNGKAHDTYQTMGAALALSGMAALVFDPIDQGERIQLLDKAGKEMMWGTRGHTMAGIGSMLVGRNTAWYEIWDGMRALDYLQSRPEVDGDRIGCTGNSGGGTQTSYLMALDERIKAAAPSCFLNRQGRQIDNSPGDAEQNIFGQLAFGMDHADYVMMRAPRPVLMLAATQDFFDIQATWVSFRYAKRLYSRMGFAGHVDLLENDAKHNYDKLQREGALRWMSRWLLKQDKEIQEPRIETLTDAELRCTPRGQVMLMPGARSVYDLNAERETQLAERRGKLWAGTPAAELRDRIRRIAGIRKLAELPEPKVRQAGTAEHNGRTVEKLIILPEPGIFLPALQFAPAQASTEPAVLYLHETDLAADANASGAIERFLKVGRTVLAVSLRGTGQTQQTAQGKFGSDLGRDWADVYKAYLLGRSYVGMRAEDVLVCARYAAGSAGNGSVSVELVAVGNVGVPALHAAVLEPQLFASVKLSRTLASWSSVAHARQTNNQLVNAVHGALETYDLPDLAGMLGGKLTLDQPVDPQARPIRAGALPRLRLPGR